MLILVADSTPCITGSYTYIYFLIFMLSLKNPCHASLSLQFLYCFSFNIFAYGSSKNLMELVSFCVGLPFCRLGRLIRPRTIRPLRSALLGGSRVTS